MRTIARAAAGIAFALGVGGAAHAAPCNGFTDVDDTSPFCVNVAWMKNRGITLGCSATLYCPNDFVTRLQMAAFMYRLGFQNAFLQGGNAFGTAAVLGTSDAQPLELHVGATRVMRYQPTNNTVGGHPGNAVNPVADGQTIAGGGTSDTTCLDPATGATNAPCTNSTLARLSTVGGGLGNRAGGAWSVIAGGSQNATGHNYATVAGGFGNYVGGQFSAALGGRENAATQPYALAAGRRAKASYQGAFLWADSTDLDFKVQADEFGSAGPGWGNASNTFNVRATGGVWFVTGVDGSTGRPTAGAYLNPGDGAWGVTSDAASKTDVHAVDPQEVLAKALTLEVSRWRYRTAPGIEHIGPMAQDFHRAFNVGSDERSITTVDADGVALAAIQGLNAKLEAKLAQKDAALAERDARIARLEAGLEAMRRTLDAMSARSERDASLANR